MLDQPPVLRASWSSRTAGSRVSAVLAVVLVVFALVWTDGWVRILLVTLGASIAVRTLVRWSLSSVVVRDDAIVYRVDLRRVRVPLAAVAAFSTHEVSGRRTGRGIAILPDRPLATLPVPLVTPASAERFVAWLRRRHPDIEVDPTGTWCDRFGRWHVDGDSVDPRGLLTAGVRPVPVGDSSVEIEAIDGGFRAVRRDRAGGEVREAGSVHEQRRDAVADGVDLYRRAAESV